MLSFFILLIICVSIPSLLGIKDSIWYKGIGAAIAGSVSHYIFSHMAIPTLRPFYSEFIKSEL